jgi:hypothetical protein
MLGIMAPSTRVTEPVMETALSPEPESNDLSTH